MDNALWSEIVKAAISLFVLVATAAIPFIGKWASQHFSLKQITMVEGLAQIAVRAAEQINASQHPGVSIDKYTAATKFLDDLANAHNITLDQAQIRPLIEGAVYRLNAFEQMPLPLEGMISSVSAGDNAVSIEEIIEQKLEAALRKVVWHPEVPATKTAAA